jgi:cell division protein FtsL
MKKTEKKPFFKLAKVLVFLVLFLALVQVYISHRLTTAGKLVGETEAKTEQVRQENEIIQEEIDQEGSLTVVAERAEELGFRPAKEIVYLTPETPVALNR